MALDMLVREELGLDPDELGSPWGAAFGSFVAFAIGAAIPVIPFLFGGGTPAVVVSLALSLVALFVVGAGVSLLTGRGLLFSGLPPAGHRPGRRGRDLRHRLAHRRARWRDERSMTRRRRLRDRLRAEGLDPGAWSNGPGDRYARPRARLRQGHRRGRREHRLRAAGERPRSSGWPTGDRLELPAGTAHDAVVGPDGVTCLEAHRPAGTLAGLARREAGSW